VDDLKRQGKVEFCFPGEYVGNAVSPEPGEVRVGNAVAQHNNKRVAADIGSPPGDPTVLVEYSGAK